ncbi:MAG: type IX secretion system sortase PorU [Prevotella sp.]|nr:type IX secretion system sortase PorU [Prevotella sp.]
MERVRRLVVSIVLLLMAMATKAQEFYNLTAQEVKVDSVLPLFTYTQELGAGYADSVYTVSIDYPEFIDMTEGDIARLKQITRCELPPMPHVEQYIGVARRRGTLYVAFVPLVFRNGHYQKLVSFKLTVTAAAVATARSSAPTGRYAAHSVLASGSWAKIRVPSSGVYQLTDALVRKAGFSDLSKVKIYGYGGNMQPEQLTADYLAQTDDLEEVPTCNVGGKRLFYADGPVSWSANTVATRTRNPYSNYGYYFLTQNDSTALTQSEDEFKAANYPQPQDYHTLYETDDYSWFHGGRNLYDSRLFGSGTSHSYQLAAPEGAAGKLTVALSYDAAFAANIVVNGTTVGTFTANPSLDQYTKAAASTKTFAVDALLASNTVTIEQTTGGNLRLDYLSLQYDTPQAWPDLSATTLPVPEYVHNITNQDHHADSAADMVIVIPTSQKLLSEAQRLADFHRQHDSLRVNIVPADELYNEFASGTPDANAYRRYLKMLYDRAETEADMPRFLLLFGDGAWDNRMLTSSWKDYSTDDFLLCYESENSFSEIDCYVSDDYFCLMDDGEGAAILTSDKSDVAVGRFPVRTADEAKIMVDKTIGYMQNDYAGPWQNTFCALGDDGDNNRHMTDADNVATMVAQQQPALNIKKIYWDAYERQSSSTGFSYPEVTQLIQQQMKSGALIMNYSGHGAPYTMSHEQVVKLTDFNVSSANRLPLWLTASCDIMPFDGQQDNIGETAILCKDGGAVAFYGTTRTVYAHYNGYMNRAYTRYAIGADTDGRRYTIGEAGRLAKNLLMTPSAQGNDIGMDQTANKLQFSLLGDPALTLALPTMQVVVDSINGQPATKPTTLRVGQTVTVKGHIAQGSNFSGVVTATVRDIEQTITCRLNNTSEASTPFTFDDRLNTLYSGSDSVRNGQFALQFVLPKDISYNEGTGLITLYAVSNDHSSTAHGYCSNFTMEASEQTTSDGIGPNIYCYLNSSAFVNGGAVNATPLFHAELYDRDGINVSEGGIGHNLELIVDGQLAYTYALNDYFQFDFGDYRSGTLNYSLPTLEAGQHSLLFRAWDTLNNSSTAELQFQVVKGLEPSITSISCSPNPATTSTTFLISHDRSGSQVDVQLDVFDTSGRQLWQHTETGLPTDQSYTISWDLCTSGGHRLQTGVYLYRVSLSSGGSTQTSMAKKLIIALR